MKTLVTGSNGLLGQKLIQLLSQNAVETIATSRGENRLEIDGNYKYASLDITDSEAVSALIADEKPDVLINCAAMTQVDQCETDQEACDQLNVEAVRYLINACEASDIFFIQLSTDFIFDGKAGPYDEEAKPNPVSHYGLSKLRAEQIVQESKCEWAIIRTVLVYGVTPSMSRSNIILWVKNSLENGKPIQVVDDQWRTPTLAEDLAMGCYLTAKKRAKGVFNISGPDLLTPYEMANLTADFYELDKSLITRADASTFSQPAKRPPRTGFILDKARSVLGYQPKRFKEGMEFMSRQVLAYMS